MLNKLPLCMRYKNEAKGKCREMIKNQYERNIRVKATSAKVFHYQPIN